MARPGSRVCALLGAAALIGALLVAVTLVDVVRAPVASASVPTVPSPMALGTVTVRGGCGSNATCTSIVVSCPRLDDETVYLSLHTATAPRKGTVVWFSGGTGQSFITVAAPEAPAFVQTLQGAGLDVIEARFVDLPWFMSPAGVPVGFPATGCRPATTVKWVHDAMYVPPTIPSPPGACGFCVAGSSGGSSAVAYLLARYQIDSFIDAAFEISGPTFAVLKEGCLLEYSAYDYPVSEAYYVDDPYGYSGKNKNGPCVKHDASFTPTWDADGAAAPGKFVYPNTRLEIIMGATDGGAPVHQSDGYIAYARAAGAFLAVTRAPKTPHSVVSTAEGRAAMFAALTAVPPPPPTISAAVINGLSATFTFSDAQAARFECSVDAAPASECFSPLSLSGLTSGGHRLAIDAVDGNNRHSTLAIDDWTATDIPLPAAPTFDSTPANPGATNATFTFHSAAATSFTCSLDGAAATSCLSPVTYTPLPSGPHTLAVVASNSSGSTGPTSFAWTVDADPPPTATFTAVPTDPSDGPVSFSFSDGDATAGFTCALDGNAATACTSPRSLSLASGHHTFAVTAKDGVGNFSAPASYGWTVVDTTKPAPPTFSPAPAAMTGPSATFSFADSEPGVAFSCALDAAPASACASPLTVSGLGDGSHHVTVTAADPSANDSDPLSFTWTVDATAPPVPVVVSGPANPSDQNATFTLTESDPSAGLQCALDSAASNACTSPVTYSGLPVGPHTFSVVATDSFGNRSGAATYSWTVTVPPPAPSIDSRPLDGAGPSGTVAFSDSQAGVAYRCSLDAAPAAACTSPFAFAGLANGSHSFSATAVNGAGQTSSATSFGWTVDAVAPPAPVFDSTPADPANATATYAFHDAEAGVAFTCSLDDAIAAPCSSPDTRTSLPTGPHHFAVTATDAAGNPATTTYSWQVVDVTPPPVPSIDTKPTNPGPPTSAFTFSDGEAGATFECALDGAAFTGCGSPTTVGPLAGGSHAFAVRAVDAAANRSTAVSTTWVVDAQPPTVTLTRPTVDSLLTTLTTGATWTASDANGMGHYDLYQRINPSGAESLVYSATGLTWQTTGAASTTYCYRVVAFDSVGNSTSSPVRCAATPTDDPAPTFSYSGAVAASRTSGAYSGTLTTFDAPGEQVTFSLTGSRFGLMARTSPGSGIAEVVVDGAVVQTVNLYTAKTVDRTMVYQANVTPGLHTITLRWTGTQDSRATGNAIAFDGAAWIAM